MSLPEDEQRQLQEIEQALCRDDPKFARRIRATDPRCSMRRGSARAFRGGDQDGQGREAPARADQACPDDAATGRALASPPGG